MTFRQLCDAAKQDLTLKGIARAIYDANTQGNYNTAKLLWQTFKAAVEARWALPWLNGTYLSVLMIACK